MAETEQDNRRALWEAEMARKMGLSIEVWRVLAAESSESVWVHSAIRTVEEGRMSPADVFALQLAHLSMEHRRMMRLVVRRSELTPEAMVVLAGPEKPACGAMKQQKAKS